MNWDICPIDGAPTIEADAETDPLLHCSQCDWEIGIKVTQYHVDSVEQIENLMPLPEGERHAEN